MSFSYFFWVLREVLVAASSTVCLALNETLPGLLHAQVSVLLNQFVVVSCPIAGSSVNWNAQKQINIISVWITYCNPLSRYVALWHYKMFVVMLLLQTLFAISMYNVQSEYFLAPLSCFRHAQLKLSNFPWSLNWKV